MDNYAHVKKSSLKKIWSSALIVFSVVALFGALYYFLPQSEEVQEEVLKKVELSEVKKQKIQKVIEHVGIAKAADEVAVSAKTGGRVSRIYFKEGDYVEKGQLLMRVEEDYRSSEVMVNLQNARSNVNDAATILERTKLEASSNKDQAETDLDTKENILDEVLEENKQKLLNEKREAITAMENLLFVSEQVLNLVDTSIGISDEEVGNINTRERLGLGAMNRTALDDLKKAYRKARELIDKSYVMVKQARAEGQDDMSNLTAYVVSAARSAEANLYYADIILKSTIVHGPYRTIDDLDDSRQLIDQTQNELNNAILSLQREHNQVLATIKENETSLTRAKNDVQNAEKSLESTVSRSEVSIKQAENSLTQRKNDLNLANVNVYNTDIRAPISGVIVDSDVDVGELISAGSQFSTGTNIALIVDVSQLEIDVYVSELDLPLISMGQEVKITVDAFPEEEFIGKVSFISDRAEDDVRTFRITVLLENPDKKIKSGMTARVYLSLEEREVVTVPLDAVVSKLKNNVLFVVDETGVADERKVELGIIDGEQVEIKEGIKEGEMIVVLGQELLRDGDKVEIIKEDEVGE